MPLMLATKKQAPERQKDDDSRRALAGMSLSMAMNESFMRITRPDLERRLAFQRGIELDAEKERKDAAEKKAADATQTATGP
jgi:hypothetical protein